MKRMTTEVMERILRSYEETEKKLNEERRLMDSYCDRPQYTDFGLGVKEAYEEYVSSVNYDE